MLKFVSLSWAICKQNLQERFAGSLLGSLWVFIWPAVQLAVYMLIFGKLMGGRLGMNQGAGSYGLYIASGLLCWTCFANILTRSARSIVDKRGIIIKVKVCLAVFPAAVCLEELIPLIAGFVLLNVIALFLGWQPQIFWLLMCVLAIYALVLLAFGLGLFLGCIAPFARDINEAVPIVMQLAFWFTPIVYVPAILPAWLGNILWINPMSGITGIFQQSFVLGGPPQWGAVGYALVVAHLALALGIFTWHRLQKDIRDVL